MEKIGFMGFQREKDHSSSIIVNELFKNYFHTFQKYKNTSA